MKNILFSILVIVPTILSAQTGLLFDNVDDSVVIGQNSDLGIIDAITVECWVKFPSAVYSTAVCSFESNGAFSYASGWWLGSDGTGPWFWLADTLDMPNGYSIYGTTIISDGDWHHLAGTYGADDSARVYIDGILENTVEAINVDFVVDTFAYIGYDTDQNLTDITIEDVRIWNITRTSAEIDLWKDSCLTGNESGLVAFYHFEEGSGTTTEDLTPNNNDADLYNFGAGGWVAGLHCEICDIQDTYATISQSGCDSVVSPSGNYTWLMDGVFNDTITNAKGCDSIITATITLTPLDLNTTLTGFTIMADLAGASYQWMDCSDSSLIMGEIDQSFIATVNGNYAVIIDNGLCSDTSACVTIAGVGQDDYYLNQFLIFPNPTEDRFSIQIDDSNVGEQLLIFDTRGRVVYQTTLTQHLSEINAPLRKGVYYIQVADSSREKLIILK